MIQCHLDAYLLALAAITGSKTKIANDFKLIDAVMRATDSSHVRQHTHKQLSEITTQALLLSAKLLEAKKDLLTAAANAGIDVPLNA